VGKILITVNEKNEVNAQSDFGLEQTVFLLEKIKHSMLSPAPQERPQIVQAVAVPRFNGLPR
jgi:hypothetical protein